MKPPSDIFPGYGHSMSDKLDREDCKPPHGLFFKTNSYTEDHT